MTHPITPPPELVQQWNNEAIEQWAEKDPPRLDLFIATRAAQWGADQQLKLDAEQIEKAYQAGADQELEACCKELEYNFMPDSRSLRAARRPKPTSLKEQALKQLDGIAAVFRMSHGGDLVCDKIRRALEALPDD